MVGEPGELGIEKSTVTRVHTKNNWSPYKDQSGHMNLDKALSNNSEGFQRRLSATEFDPPEQ